MVFAGACSYGVLSIVKLAYREGYQAAEISFTQALLVMAVLSGCWCSCAKDAFRVNWPLLWTGAAISLLLLCITFPCVTFPHHWPSCCCMQFVWMGILLDWLLFKQRPGMAADRFHPVDTGGFRAGGRHTERTPVFAEARDSAAWLATASPLALGSAFLHAIFTSWPTAVMATGCTLCAKARWS